MGGFQMKNNQQPKEELLEKLTEIYDQLEELEKTLDNNLSEHRKKMVNEQASRLNDCNQRILMIEDAYDGQKYLKENQQRSRIHSNAAMKLELGF